MSILRSSCPVLLATLLSIGWTGCRHRPPATPPVKGDPANIVPSSSSSHPAPDDVAAAIWIKQGWTEDAATAVASHNKRYLTLVYEEDRIQFNSTVVLLARLGNHSYAQQQMVQMPELAGLLAGSLEHDEDGPELILKTIPSGEHRDLVLSLYCLSAMPSDCISLARTLENDRDVVIELCKRDALDAVIWLTPIPTEQEGAVIYRSWVRSVLESALNAAEDDELDRAQTMLAIHASAIREKLNTSQLFRRKFLAEYWPIFNRILAQQTDELGWGIFVSEPRVWNFFDEFGAAGQKLYNTHGPLAVELLFMDEYEGCKQQVLEALMLGDELTIQSLYDPELKAQPLFAKLIKRSLPGGTIAKALHLLASKPSGAPRLLSDWGKLTDAALIEDLGPPPEGPQTWLPGYNIYYLGRKVAQGRDVAGMDVVFAAVDTVEVVFMAKGAGKGLKLIQHGLKEGLGKRGLKEASEGVSKLSSRQLYPWVLREGHRACRQAYKSIRNRAIVDVTGAVKFAFQKSGIGRRSFKELSGLEARVFMRADRRVALDLGSLVEKDHFVGRALRESAVNAGFDVSLRTESGEAATETVVESGLAARDFSEKQIKAWREHVSIWWLAANDGSLKPRREQSMDEEARIKDVGE